MRERIGLIGNGGQADEAATFYCGEIAFRAVSKDYLTDVAYVDIDNPTIDQRSSAVCLAVGAPGLKRKLYERWLGDNFISIVSQYAYIDKSADYGVGCIIAPKSVITTSVKLGRHVLVNVAATIQHNTSVGDFTSIGPGVHIAGNVSIGDGVFVGIGANISNNVNIARGAVIGAGSTLLHDASTENGVYVGVPARLLRINEGWIYEI